MGTLQSSSVRVWQIVISEPDSLGSNVFNITTFANLEQASQNIGNQCDK